MLLWAAKSASEALKQMFFQIFSAFTEETKKNKLGAWYPTWIVSWTHQKWHKYGVFLTFKDNIMDGLFWYFSDKVWYLIVSIPDLCTITYFQKVLNPLNH